MIARREVINTFLFQNFISWLRNARSYRHSTDDLEHNHGHFYGDNQCIRFRTLSTVFFSSFLAMAPDASSIRQWQWQCQGLKNAC